MFEKFLARVVALRASRPSLRGNTSGRLSMESVGWGLTVFGAIVAIAMLLGILFIPAATFPLIDAEFGALVGVILLVAGVLVHSAD